MTMFRRIVPLLLAAYLAGPTPAQDTEPDIANLKTKADLNEEDRTQVRNYVNVRVGRIVNSPLEARQATEDLRAALDGTEGFKKEFATICLEAIGSAYKKAELLPATRLLSLLNALNVTPTHTVLVEALQDDRAGVRAAAAIGLRGLREKIAAAGRDVYQRVLDALKDAGKREKSRETLRAIYAAMNYAELPSAPDTKGNIAALLELIEARAAAYTPTGAPALGADDAALRLLLRLLRSFDDTERRRLTIATATLLRHAITLYAVGENKLAHVQDKDAARDAIDARNGVERLIIVGEELLVALVKPEKAPNVVDALKKLDTTEMQNQWKEWVSALQKAVSQDFSITETDAEASGGGI